MDTGQWWAIGALFTLVMALFSYIWNTNNGRQEDIQKLQKALKDDAGKLGDEMNKSCTSLHEDISKLAERVMRLETTVEPLKQITMQAVPKMLNLHHSGDVLEEAFFGPPDPEKISVAEQRVQEEWDRNPPPERLLPLVLAKWLLAVKRRELERDQERNATT